MIMMGMKNEKNHLEDFFQLFLLDIRAEVPLCLDKADWEVYWWWEDSHLDCRDWFVLQDLRIRYAPHLERPQFNDLVAEYKEILAGMEKILERMTIEDSKPEPEIDEPESGPEVVELVSL